MVSSSIFLILSAVGSWEVQFRPKMGGRPPTTFFHAQNMIYMCFSILKGPDIHVSPNHRPNELKIGRNSKQRSGNPNPASKMTPEYKLVDKSVTNVVLEVKMGLNGLKLGPYSNSGVLSTNLASEIDPGVQAGGQVVTNDKTPTSSWGSKVVLLSSKWLQTV